MAYSVQEKAESIGTFRWIEVRLMEMLAQWVPSTPEMEVKILFGRHLWNCAQHADALGRRAFELRAPLHYTLPPKEVYQSLLRDVAALEATADRVGAFYDVICHGVANRYHTYIENTDALMDEPTVRILENALANYDRMSKERRRYADDTFRLTPGIDVAQWSARDPSLEDVVAHGEADKRARGVPA